MKLWQPGCIVCETADEHYEPIEATERALAAKITLTIRLAMHRAEIAQKNKSFPRVEHPRCRCVVKPIADD
jgi:hypothetical protein